MRDRDLAKAVARSVCKQGRLSMRWPPSWCVVNTWRTHCVQIGVTAGDIEHSATFIDGDVLQAQRRGFAQRRYARAVGTGGDNAECRA